MGILDKKSVPKRHGTAKVLETKIGPANSISSTRTDATTWPKMPKLPPFAATQAPRALSGAVTSRDVGSHAPGSARDVSPQRVFKGDPVT
ncbi:unnamed protein product [Lampetra fluviatilis]